MFSICEIKYLRTNNFTASFKNYLKLVYEEGREQFDRRFLGSS
jgi:hypothetical protein